MSDLSRELFLELHNENNLQIGEATPMHSALLFLIVYICGGSPKGAFIISKVCSAFLGTAIPSVRANIL
jgi:hypothetical protein